LFHHHSSKTNRPTTLFNQRDRAQTDVGAAAPTTQMGRPIGKVALIGRPDPNESRPEADAMTIYRSANNSVRRVPVANESDLSLVMQGHFAFQTLYAGHKVGIYTYLAAHPGATRDDLAAALRLADRPTTYLLSALRTLGLITGPDTALRNTAVAEQHLVDDRPDSYAPILDWYHAIVYPLASGLTDSLRRDTNVGLDQLTGEGDTVYERLASNPDLQKIFHLGMSAISRIAVEGLVGSHRFARHQRVLDIGAGDATNSIALLRTHRHLTSVLVDLPSVLELAREKVADSGVADRMQLCPSDIFSDPFPDGVDAVLFAHVMPIFSVEENLFLLEQAYKVLPEGGSVFIYNTMRNDTDDDPTVYASLFSAYFITIASNHGVFYSWADYETWLSQTGFSAIERTDRPLPLDHGLISAVKK
jgi:L-tyrosine C(3)-methyltransferase